MDTVKISKKSFSDFIGSKIGENSSRMIGVVKKGNRFIFDEIKDADQMCLDYDVTILPPKKFFQPPKEVLLRFAPKKADSYEAVNEYAPMTIVGIHYYDLAAINLMDRAFSEGEYDENYMKKRENSLLIGMYPTRSFKNRFARSVVRGDHPYKAADLMLIDMGDDHYAVEIVTDKGKNYIAKADTEKSAYTNEQIDAAKLSVKDDERLPIPTENTPDYLAKNHDHEVWGVFGEKCYSCGSCVLVCPTCYCFNVADEIELSLESGQRVRVWDGCMLEDFAVCAGGHNFRDKRAARFRHRIYRKGVTLPQKYHYWGCVGCGRCADACTASIAGPVKVMKYIEENK